MSTIPCQSEQKSQHSWLPTNSRNDIHILPLRFSRNMLHQRFCARLNTAVRRHGGGNHSDPLGGQRVLDAVPVLDGRQQAPGQTDLIEAEEAVG